MTGCGICWNSVALSRENDAAAQQDQRYAEAARNIRLIASTLHEVDDALMVDVAMIDKASDGMASKLIAARLTAIGFELPPFASASAFFAVFCDMIEKVRKQRLQ